MLTVYRKTEYAYPFFTDNGKKAACNEGSEKAAYPADAVLYRNRLYNAVVFDIIVNSVE